MTAPEILDPKLSQERAILDSFEISEQAPTVKTTHAKSKNHIPKHKRRSVLKPLCKECKKIERGHIPDFLRRRTDNHSHIRCSCDCCGYTHMIDALCNDRTCPQCNYRRKKRILMRFEGMSGYHDLRYFLTLTTKRMPLKMRSTKEIKRWFKLFRRRKIFKGVSGLFNVELGTIKIEWNQLTANYHIHMIINGNVDIRDIRREWEDITGANWVHIEPCTDGRGALKYLAKHSTKLGNEITVTDDKTRRAINCALRGVRMIEGFGNLEGVTMSIDDTVCPQCGAVNSFVSEFDRCYRDVIALSQPIVSDSSLNMDGDTNE